MDRKRHPASCSGHTWRLELEKGLRVWALVLIGTSAGGESTRMEQKARMLRHAIRSGEQCISFVAPVIMRKFGDTCGKCQ